MQTQLDFKDIQGLVFSSYGRLRLARYVFLRIAGPEKARTWLQWLADEVTTTAALLETRDTVTTLEALNVAFTVDGLRALGLEEKELRGAFPPEFVEGMAAKHRSRVLGDTGWSAPGHWEFGGSGGERPQKDVHAVLLLFTAGRREDKRRLERFHARQRERYEAHGLEELFTQDADLLPASEDGGEGAGVREPFGFRVGVSQPVIEGSPCPATLGPSTKPGEVLLGHENAQGLESPSPTVPGEWDAGNHLPGVPGSSRKDLGCNGSYLVIRKLWQDVTAFEAFLDAHGGRDRELLAAKLMGRWRSGAPLALSPERDDPELGADDSRNNCFAYAQDPQGMLCPVGAHIRRCNPRDGLIPGKREASLEVMARHYLLRRARVYHDEGWDARGREQRGMFFLALTANIRSQFEFIQHTWLNSSKFGGHYDSKDPIAGDNPDAAPPPGTPAPKPSSVTLPDFPISRRIEGLPRFVEVRGGGYFFLPGIKALRFLGALKRSASEVAAPHRQSLANPSVFIR